MSRQENKLDRTEQEIQGIGGSRACKVESTEEVTRQRRERKVTNVNVMNAR